ncbi:MAG: radical SAM protein [Endomicrobium sp.]|jgi:cyclic pyranopterin phosphate synthase|uniref:radical SAM protein n=1 Tax=Candidatus Endomicrobiellum cubanum TaxID=3242325 RepID=UPI00281C8C3F|nr:radical SAM protein [Endomicrobium sp.]
MKQEDLDYVLRISLPKCNLKCSYCRKDEANIPNDELLSNKELLDIIRASYTNGIRRIRWTGGEPTVNKGFLDIVKAAKDVGIVYQMLSTNGTTLDMQAENLAEAGINRVNISLDTLNRAKFYEVTKFDMLDDVLTGIKQAIGIFEKIKINTVLTKENADDCLQLLDFIYEIAHGENQNKIAIRFIELIPGGFEGDEQYVASNFISGEQLVENITKKYGKLKLTTFEGDNPMCTYRVIKQPGVIFGIIPHFSVNFQCGGKRCKKIRLNPTGTISNCSIHKKFGHNIKNTSYEEKLKILKYLIEEKANRSAQEFKELKHFQSDYSFWRFGKKSQ